MRIGIDARLAATMGGIGRYAFDLVRALGRYGGNKYIAFVGPEQDTSWIPNEVEIVRLRKTGVPILGAHFQIAAQIKAAKCDLVHFPHLNVPLGYDRPYVATVHDLSIYRYPEWFARGQWFSTRVVTPRALKKAKRLIAISEDMAKLTAARFNVPVEKIAVVSNGVDTEIFKPATGAKRDFVLFVGSAAPYKNIPLLNAVVKKLYMPAHVAGASRNDFARVLGDIAPNFIFYPNNKFNDPGLVDLYQHAKCVLQTSLYESFALPILEALACGTPVVAADIESLRNIYGSAVSYAPLDNAEAWIAVMADVKIGPAADELVKKHEWRVLTSELDMLYGQAI